MGLMGNAPVLMDLKETTVKQRHKEVHKTQIHGEEMVMEDSAYFHLLLLVKHLMAVLTTEEILVVHWIILGVLQLPTMIKIKFMENVGLQDLSIFIANIKGISCQTAKVCMVDNPWIWNIARNIVEINRAAIPSIIEALNVEHMNVMGVILN